jgi:hypothetical protein
MNQSWVMKAAGLSGFAAVTLGYITSPSLEVTSLAYTQSNSPMQTYSLSIEPLVHML